MGQESPALQSLRRSMGRLTFRLRLDRSFSVNLGFGGKNCVKTLENDEPPVALGGELGSKNLNNLRD